MKVIILRIGIIIVLGIISLLSFKKYSKKIKTEHSIVTSISSRLFDFNTFNLKVDKNLNLSNFRVINKNSGKTIFVNGESKKGIENDYGYRLFELFYLDQKIFEFGHFSKNNWHTYNYELNLKINNSTIDPDLKISRDKNSYDNDFFYKKFEYDNTEKLDRISYLTLNKDVYNVEQVNK